MMPIRIALAILLLTVAAWQLGGALWIDAKAVLGQLLLERSWSQLREGHDDARPWPWADIRPVARLHVPDLQIDQLVLAGDTGATLAWAPGLITTAPGSINTGHIVISAHRDTHFRFLADLDREHEIRLEETDGRTTHWQVSDMQIIDSQHTALDLHAPGPLLTLVTCYPFNAIQAGGPLRYVVSLRPVAHDGGTIGS